MSRAPLVGRDAEVEILADALAELRAGRGGLVLMVGEPGIGKSRLAEELARLAVAGGDAVVWGRAWEAGGAPPYWPWIQVLRGVGADEAVVARLLGDGKAGPTSPEDRFLLFDATARVLLGASAVVILEDLHAADEASLHLLAFLATQLRTARLLVVGTYRDVEARMTPAAGAVLDRVTRAARTIAPRRLACAEIAALDPTLDGELVGELYRRSEGNPLFVIELLRVIARRGPGGGPLAIPASVRTAIREHLRGLPSELPPLLEIAAAIGREFSATVVGELGKRALDDVLDALGTAVDLGVLVERTPGRFAFAHGLIAETLHHDLAAARRAQLHLAIANAFEQAHAPLAEIAHHLFEAGAEEATRAVAVARRAAEQARRLLAYEPAAALVERALAILPPGNALERFELLRLHAEVWLYADDLARGREIATEAAALARSLHSPELLARAALTYGGMWQFGVTDQVLVQLVEESLATLPSGDSPLRARLMARLAAALQPAHASEPPMVIAREAIAMANRLGDPRTCLEVWFAASGALALFAPPAERRELNLATLALAERFDEPVIQLRTHHRLVFDHAELGDLTGLAVHHRSYDALVERLRIPKARWASPMFHAMVALAQGRFAEHDAAFAEAEALAAAAGDGFFLQAAKIGHRAHELLLIGDVARIAANEHVFVEMGRWLDGTFGTVSAQMWAVRGDLARVRVLLTQTQVAAVLAHQLLGLSLNAADALWRLDDRGHAETLYPALAMQGGRLATLHSHGYVIHRPAAHGAMQLAAKLGDLAAARRHYEVAAAVLRRIEGRPLEAWLQLHFAEILAGTGDPAVHDEAHRLLESARTLCRTTGIAIEPQIDAVVARLGAPSQPTSDDVTMQCEGEIWVVAGLGTMCRLKTSRGVELLARLVREPGRELHALDLTGDGDGVVDGGDAGEILDAEAKAAYKTRALELREELEEAEQWNDAARTERARDELEALTAELSRATGLGGRARRSGRAAERARINVQRRLADAIRRVTEGSPELGRHLARSLRTGTFCSYSPDRTKGR